MASRSLNKVMLIGNLTRDPELRYTPQGTAVCTFGLATNRSWVSDGQQKEDVEFHRIVAWQKLAELCSQLLFKGRKAFVGGRLQTRRWTDKEGQQRQTTEVVIDNMIVLDSKHRERGEAVPSAGGPSDVAATSAQPAPDDTGQVKVGDEPAEDKGEEKKDPAEKSKSKGKEVKVASGSAEPAEEEEKVSADDIPF